MHLDLIGCTTHYDNLIIEFLAENHPKNIYNMSTFCVCKKVTNSPEVRGLDARLHCKYLEKGSDEEIIITMQILGGNYPKSIYGMAHFEFGLNFEKKEFEQGLVAKFDQHSFNEVVKSN